MTPEEYRDAVKALNAEHAKKLRKLNGEYAESEKKYQEGDVVELLDGTFVAIERTNVSVNVGDFPVIMYEGPTVNANGEPSKKQGWRLFGAAGVVVRKLDV